MPEAACGGCGAPVKPWEEFCQRCWRPTGPFSPVSQFLAGALPCYGMLAGLATEVLGPKWKLSVPDENPSYLIVLFGRAMAFSIFHIDLKEERWLFSNGWEDVKIVAHDTRFTEAAVSFSHAMNEKIGIQATV